jgi:hypothetical protein
VRALGLLAIVAACGGDSQIVLELTGSAPGAERLEVLILDPLVMAKRQLHNLESTTSDRLETVFYMAERSRTTFELGGAAIDGLQLEIQGADGPYVPLVAARAGDRLLALGVYNPASIFAAELGREHAPAAVSPVGDVTIYSIELEPVDRAFSPATGAPQAVAPREVMAVPCGAGGAMSGFAWRRADLHQLRVVLSIPTRPAEQGGTGKDLLDPPDLDCDEHTPGPAGVLRISVGDERDCDDTAPAIHGGARERCSSFDEDCNSLTTLSPAPCEGACTAPACFCDDEVGAGEVRCPIQLGACTVPSISSGGEGLQPCESAGVVLLPPCQAGCEVLLEAVPEGLEIAISDDVADPGQGPGQWVPISDGKAWLEVKASVSFSTPDLFLAARFKTALGTSQPFVLGLKLLGSGQCADPSMLGCPTL